MNQDEMREGIEERYGPINLNSHRFYVIASVPLFKAGTAAIGVDESIPEAIRKLYANLRQSV